MPKKIVICSNSSWNIFNFRLKLIESLIDQGFDIVIYAPYDDYAQKLKEKGLNYFNWKINSNGKNPFFDLISLLKLIVFLKSQQPDLFLSFTIKPNIYGAIACRLLNIKAIVNIAGLGNTFIGNKIVKYFTTLLYKYSLKNVYYIFFQNRDDQNIFIDLGIGQHTENDCLPGSGVDLTKFQPLPLPNETKIKFLFVGRCLWNKGLAEFAEAARIFKERGLPGDFRVLGFVNARDPSAIPLETILRWQTEGCIQYLGASDNVQKYIAAVDCVVLPSYYREGTPRSLLEAASMARPLITTNSVGCRDAVEDGLTGFLCDPQDPISLFEKMHSFTQLSAQERHEMGQRGREKMEKEFNELIVIKKYKDVINLSF